MARTIYLSHISSSTLAILFIFAGLRLWIGWVLADLASSDCCNLLRLWVWGSAPGSLFPWASQVIFLGRCRGRKDRTNIADTFQAFSSVMDTSIPLPKVIAWPNVKGQRSIIFHLEMIKSEYFLKEEEYYFARRNKTLPNSICQTIFLKCYFTWEFLSDTINLLLTVFSKPVQF